MVHLIGVVSLLVTILFAHVGLAQAESWDLGYTNSNPEVEEIPDTISIEEEELAGDVKAEIKEVSDQDQEIAPVRSSTPISKISTAQNTYGVQTIEKSGLKLFLSPIAGLTSILGNGTVNVAPQYAYGARVGLLVSDSLMVEGGYTYSLMNTSTPVNNIMGAIPDVFALKQSTADAGAKFFFLGRESRFRPFIGGGFAYSNSNLNYTQSYSSLFLGLTDDYKMKQLQGLGQVGAEIAITRGIVLTTAFKVNGILSSSTESIKNESLATGLEANKVQAGSSLSRSASYTGSVGVGVYF